MESERLYTKSLLSQQSAVALPPVKAVGGQPGADEASTVPPCAGAVGDGSRLHQSVSDYSDELKVFVGPKRVVDGVVDAKHHGSGDDRKAR